jgi:hypothetical protein
LPANTSTTAHLCIRRFAQVFLSLTVMWAVPLGAMGRIHHCIHRNCTSAPQSDRNVGRPITCNGTDTSLHSTNCTSAPQSDMNVGRPIMQMPAVLPETSALPAIRAMDNHASCHQHTHTFGGGRRAVWEAKSMAAAPPAWKDGLRELRAMESPGKGVPTTETSPQSAAG